MALKNSVTPPVIDPGTVRLNHYVTPGPGRECTVVNYRDACLARSKSHTFLTCITVNNQFHTAHEGTNCDSRKKGAVGSQSLLHARTHAMAGQTLVVSPSNVSVCLLNIKQLWHNISKSQTSFISWHIAFVDLTRPASSRVVDTTVGFTLVKRISLRSVRPWRRI